MATEYEELKLTVGLDDKASDVLKSINIKLTHLGGAVQQAAVEKIGGQFKITQAQLLNFDKEAGAFAGIMGESTTAATTLAKTIGFTALGIVGVAGIVGLGMRSVKEYSESLAKLNQFSRETGFSVAAVKRLQEAFAKQGFSQQQSDAILKNVQQSMVDVLNPQSSLISTLREHARRTPETTLAMERYIAKLRESAKRGDAIEFFKTQASAVETMQKVLNESGVPPQISANWTAQFAAVQNLGPEIMRKWGDIKNVTEQDIQHYKTIADNAEKLYIATNTMAVEANRFKEAILAIPLGEGSWIVKSAIWIAEQMGIAADKAEKLRDAAGGKTKAQEEMKDKLKKALEEQNKKGGVRIPSLRNLWQRPRGLTQENLAVPGGIPQLATGGRVEGGTAILVGESGPELFVPDVSGRIISNTETAAATGQATKQLDQRQELINELKRLSDTLSPATAPGSAPGFASGGGLSSLKARMGVGGGMGGLPGMGRRGGGGSSGGSSGGDSSGGDSSGGGDTDTGPKAPTSQEQGANTVQEATERGYLQTEGGDEGAGGLTKAGKVTSGTDQAIVAAAAAHGLDPNYMRAIADIESSSNPGSNRNARTQYKGLFQLNQEEFNKNGGGDMYSAKDNANAAAKMMAGHKAWFKEKYGREPTPGELYLIHQQGKGFFTKGSLENIKNNTPPGAPVATTTAQHLKNWEERVARGTKRVYAAHGVDPNDKTGVTPGVDNKGKLKNFTLDDIKRSVKRGEGAADGTAAAALQDALRFEGKSEHNAKDRADIMEYIKNGSRNLDPKRTAWCAAFVNAALERQGIKSTGSDLANSYYNWGQGVHPKDVKPGDIIDVPQGAGAWQGGGHVGFATGNVRKDKNGNVIKVEFYGGNTGDKAQKKWYTPEEIRIRRESDEAREKRLANQPKPDQQKSVSDLEIKAKERYDAAAERNKVPSADEDLSMAAGKNLGRDYGGERAAGKNLGRDYGGPMAAGKNLGRKLLDQSLGNETRIKTSGKVTARVKSDDDTEVKVEGKGVFKGKKDVERVKEAGSSGESESAAA